MTKQEVNKNNHDKDCSTSSDLSVRVNNNDPSLDRLDLKEPRMVHCSPSFPALVKAICSGNNTTIHTVVLGEVVVQMTSSEQLSELLEALGCGLLALERIEVALYQLNDRNKRIAAPALARFLQQAHKIQMLIIWPFVSFEKRDHVQMVADALVNHATLRDLSLMNIIVVEDAQQQQQQSHGKDTLSFDPILKSLASVSNLANLQLSPGLRIVPPRNNINNNHQHVPYQQQQQQQQSEPPCLLRSPQASLCCLLQGASMLQSLALRNIGLKDNDIVAMAQALAVTAGPLHQKHTTTNTTTTAATPLLQYIDLRFNHCCADEASSRKTYLAFLHLLRDHNNCRITYIDLEDKYNNSINIDNIVDNNDNHGKDKDDSLLSLQEIKDQVDFYLHLNRAGRHAFLKDTRASKCCRVNILIASRHDVNLSFYFLRQNPCVVVCE